MGYTSIEKRGQTPFGNATCEIFIGHSEVHRQRENYWDEKRASSAFEQPERDGTDPCPTKTGQHSGLSPFSLPALFPLLRFPSRLRPFVLFVATPVFGSPGRLAPPSAFFPAFFALLRSLFAARTEPRPPSGPPCLCVISPRPAVTPLRPGGSPAGAVAGIPGRCSG